MKHVVFSLGCLAACTTSDNVGNHVFGPTRWSIVIGGAGDERSTAVAVDPTGNVLVAGTCSGDLDLGSGVVPCNGSFVSQRASETGGEQWTVELAGIRVDSLSYVGGHLIVVGSKAQAAGSDQVVSILDGTGQLLTTSTLGIVGTIVTPVGVAADDGSVFTTGGFTGSVPSTVVTTSDGDLDAYVSAQLPERSSAWSIGFSGAGSQLGTAVAVTADRHVEVLVDATGSFAIGGHTVTARAWPATLLVRLESTGELVWARALSDRGDALAASPGGDAIVAGCPTRSIAENGSERWAVPCNSDDAVVDSLAVSAQGTIVIGGHHTDPTLSDGELFLDAYDEEGSSVGGARTARYGAATDSAIAAVAIEPTGEIVLAATASHQLDFGNGMLPYAGMHDVVVVKLDSFVGRDGPIVLARQL